jgi:hypothetical protein
MATPNNSAMNTGRASGHFSGLGTLIYVLADPRGANLQ